MRVAHWSMLNNSGLCNLSFDIMEAERKLGIDSVVIPALKASKDAYGHEMLNPDEDYEKELLSVEADIHVYHSRIPNELILKKKIPFIFIQHGTPEHLMHGALNYASEKNKGISFSIGDSLMQVQFLSKQCKAMVTFHERHADIFRRMSSAPVYTVPPGVNKTFWSVDEKRLPIPGVPSVLYAENAHLIKWPFEIITAWPSVCEEIPEAKLHVIKMPYDQHRTWFPYASSIGALFTMYMSEQQLTQEGLRKLFKSVGFMVSPVIKGDHNRLSMEASAAGTKVISYTGNPYSDYWIPEGDHRVIARHMADILAGRVEPREKSDVPDISQTAEAMIEIYKSISKAGS